MTDELLDTLRTAKPTVKTTTVIASNMSKIKRSMPRRELLRARAARELQARLYYPSYLFNIRTLTSGSMLNATVTGADVKLARCLFRSSPDILVGKSKNLGPLSTTEVIVPTFKRKEQTTFADMFYLREVPFLLYIIKSLYRIVINGTNNSEH